MGSKHSLCAAGLLLAIATGPARAVDFAVDSTSDAGDALPGDGNCAALGGACTLRAAIQEANALPGADRIALPAGTFALTRPGPLEDAALTGDLDLLDDVALTGEGADRSVVDAGGLDRVLHVPFSGVAVELSGLTLRGGFAEAGGGILNAGVLGLDRVVVRECHGVGLAGGINNFGSITVTNSAIVENGTEGNAGGIANDGGTMLVLDSDVSRNRAGADAGGLGGPGAHTLVRTRVADNFAGVLGGGIAFPPGGTLVMMESSVERNEGQQGGGIASGGPAMIESSTIAGNVARTGAGGIGALGALLHVANSTISGNRATSDGGGIAQSVVDFQLRNVTITGNVTETGNGGGLSNRIPSGPVSNTILAGNVDLGGETADCSGTLTSQGHNLIEDATGCSVAGDTTGNLIGIDAQIGPLAENGGPTRTHLPKPESPAIDAGRNADPGSSENACPPTDQRGVARPQDGDGDGIAICDIGAVEVDSNEAARRVTGGGWLATLDGSKISFVLHARDSLSGPRGTLALHDHGGGAKVQLDAVEDIGPVEEPCGGVRAGARALQLIGSGRFDGESGAHFRACAEDGDGDAPDRLWLECLSGCTYHTGSRVPDNELDGGSLEVREKD